MRSRSDLLETFSSFLQFEADRPQRWTIDGRLQRNMQKALQQISQTPIESRREAKSDRYWSLYWHKVWSANPNPTTPRNLPFEHLAAYLQETCYWSISRMRSQFTQTQYSLSDCFQIAITRVPKILQGFDARQGFALTNYASTLFSTTLRDALRQQQEVDICSTWALLRKTSQKRFTDALTQAGITPTTQQHYTIAWQTFKALYVPTQATSTRQLPRPDPETWQAILNEYQRQVKTEGLAPIEPAATTAAIEQWLTRSAQALRNYLTPSLVSLNAPKTEDGSGEWQDDLTDQNSDDSLLASLIADEEHEERLTQYETLEQLLKDAIATCNTEVQTILQLYYGNKLTQQQIAKQLSIPQYTISRRLTKAKDQLLKAILTWQQNTWQQNTLQQNTLHNPPPATLLQTIGPLLDDWLQAHYPSSL